MKNSRSLGFNIKQMVLNNPALFNRLDEGTKTLLKAEFDANGNQIKQNLRAVERELAYSIALGAMGAGAATPLFDTAQAKKVGISDFEQNMQTTYDCVIAGIKFMYAPSADNVVGNKQYSNLLYSRTSLVAGGVDMDAGAAGVQSVAVPALTMPAVFLNAQFVLKIAGSEKVRRPIYQFFMENDRKDYMNGENVDFVSLEHEPIFVAKGETVTAELVTAEGIAIPAAALGYHLLRWSIKVSQFLAY